MTQRRSQGIVLLLTVISAAVLLWALAIMIRPGGAYASEPGITIAKLPDSQTVQSGGTVTFTIAVTNTGSVTLTVVVSDTLVPDCNADLGDLPPEESTTYTCTSPVVTADFTNTVIVTGTPLVGEAVTDTDTAFVDVLPTIAVTKTADPTSVPEPGGPVTFTVHVDNTSAETVTLTTLTDTVHDNLNGQGTCAVTQTIAPSGFYACAFTATVSGSHGHVVTDTVTATASDDENNSVQASDDATVTIVDLTDPVITAITVTSSNPAYFYDPGLGDTGGEVFFNSRAGEGGGQTITITVSFTDAHPDSLTGDSAFGYSPPPDTSGPPWTLTYTIGTGASSQPGRVFTVTDLAGNTDTAVITFTQDNVTPTVVITDVTNPDHDFGGNELDDDGSNWYDPDHLSTGWHFTFTFTDTLSGPALANASWDHANDAYDQLTYDPGLDGDGIFSGVSDDGDGRVTVTLTLTDHVGNAASDTVVFNLDNTSPVITSPTITEGSDYLYASGLTVYYGDDMGVNPVSFRVQGNAQDSGVGLHYVSYSAALNQPYAEDFTYLTQWRRDYTADKDNTTSGVITATIYDWVGNFATQIFTYTRDVISPTIIPTAISETSPYLHASGLTLYYSDRMGSSAQDFEVQGTASDEGAGFRWVTFTLAFGDRPGNDSNSPWSGKYDVVSSNSGPGNITVTAYDNVSNWSTAVFTYIEDTTNPTVSLTSVTPGGYDVDNPDDWLDTDGSNWYKASNFPGGNWVFTSTTADDGAGLASGSAFWNHSANQTDRTLNCGPGGDGTFSGVSGDADGTVTVTVTITDHVGNPASDAVVFNIDNTAPTITSPYISESSDYLYADGLTIYYGDDMPTAQTFTVNGHSDDGGVGLNVTDTVDFSRALWDNPSNSGTQTDWSGEYSAASGNTTSGQITVTVYDLLNNPATQVFTYTRDTGNPASVAGSPPYANESPIVVTYTNATDTGGSGLQRVWLRYKKEVTGTWITSSLLAQTGPSGSFNFTPTAGEGTYYFATRAEDNVGNLEVNPPVSVTSTIYDLTPPSMPMTFTYQLDTDSGGDGIPPEAGYYDDVMIPLQWFTPTDNLSGLPANPYHLGTAPHPTSGSYGINSPYTVTGSGIYSIYLTAEDRAGNISDDAVTGPITVDLEGPQVDVNCPSGTAGHSFVVGWSATDQGPAGLRSNPYSVSYNVDGGSWQNWITATSALTATFGPTSPVTVEDGHTYCFRMWAVDKAGNVQYTSGNDCTEVDPSYDPLREKVFLPIIMAPDPNWGFETGDFTGWQHGGQLARSVSTAMPHSGSYAALLGSPGYSCNGVPVGSAWLRRSVTVPSSGSPTLSFWYRIYTQDKNTDLSDQYDLFAVYINDSQLVVKDANTSNPYGCSNLKDLGWKQVNFSLDAYKGQTIQITFYNYNRPDNWYNTYTCIDDVAVQ